jgi:hypothetical protein
MRTIKFAGKKYVSIPAIQCKILDALYKWCDIITLSPAGRILGSLHSKHLFSYSRVALCDIASEISCIYFLMANNLSTVRTV